MIKANELRIGNIIEWNKSIFNVCKISEDSIENELWCKPLTEIHPIPLTEDWLLYFGFSGKDNFTDYNLQADNLKFYYGNNELTIAEFEFGHAISVKIEYVHQLQNIYFALTRQELKAK